MLVLLAKHEWQRDPITRTVTVSLVTAFLKLQSLFSVFFAEILSCQASCLI